MIEDGSPVCMHCGTPAEDDREDAEVRGPGPQAEPENAHEASAAKKVKKGVILIAVIVLLIAAAAIAAVSIFGKKASPAGPAGDQQDAQPLAYVTGDNKLVFLADAASSEPIVLSENYGSGDPWQYLGETAGSIAMSGYPYGFALAGDAVYYLDDYQIETHYSHGDLYKVSLADPQKREKIESDVFNLEPAGSGVMYCVDVSGVYKLYYYDGSSAVKLIDDLESSGWDYACSEGGGVTYRKGSDLMFRSFEAPSEEIVMANYVEQVCSPLSAKKLLYTVWAWSEEGDPFEDTSSHVEELGNYEIYEVEACADPDPEKVAENVYEICDFSDGRIYYITGTETHYQLSELVEDVDSLKTTSAQAPKESDFILDEARMREKAEEYEASGLLAEWGYTVEEYMENNLNPDGTYLDTLGWNAASDAYDPGSDVYGELCRESVEDYNFSLYLLKDGKSVCVCDDLDRDVYRVYPQEELALYQRIFADDGIKLIPAAEVESADQVSARFWENRYADDSYAGKLYYTIGTDVSGEAGDPAVSADSVLPIRLGGADSLEFLIRTDKGAGVVSFADGTAKVVRQLGSDALNDARPFGGKVYYHADVHSSGEGTLCRVAEGGQPETVANGVAANYWSSWLLDDGSLLYMTDLDGGDSGTLRAMSPDGTAADVAGGVSRFLPAGGGRIVYIKDGVLYLYDGKESKAIAEGVIAVVNGFEDGLCL